MEIYCRARQATEMTIRRMRTACWIPKATNTRSQYVILIAFPLQRLHERVSMLRYTYSTVHYLSCCYVIRTVQYITCLVVTLYVQYSTLPVMLLRYTYSTVHYLSCCYVIHTVHYLSCCHVIRTVQCITCLVVSNYIVQLLAAVLQLL